MTDTLSGGDEKAKQKPKNRLGCLLLLILGGAAFGLCATSKDFGP